MTEREALKLALEALKRATNYDPVIARAITAIKEALAQPEQEYYAVNAVHKGEQCYVKAQPEQPKVRTGNCLRVGVCASEGHKIAPQRTWVGLTDEEILAVNMSTVTKLIDEPIVCDTDHNIVQLGKAIEAKLRAKNAE